MWQRKFWTICPISWGSDTVIFTKTYAEPPLCQREILRYAGCKEADGETLALLHACLEEARPRLSYKLCHCVLDLTIHGDTCDFGVFSLESQKLARNLESCRQVVLFAATLGVDMDRLIARYSRLSPAKALMFQAIGAERIEALCDAFCADLAREYPQGLRPRFSPGYGDLPLESQKELFSLLDCQRNIGLTLCDSLIMSPSKSVTAFVGIGCGGKTVFSKCAACTLQDCAFRGAV